MKKTGGDGSLIEGQPTNGVSRRTEYRVEGDALKRGSTVGLYFLILRGVQQSEKTGGDGSLIEGKPTRSNNLC